MDLGSFLLIALGVASALGLVFYFYAGNKTTPIPPQSKDISSVIQYPLGPVDPTAPAKTVINFGCNYVGTENELRGCIDDVSDVKDMAVSQYGYNAYILMSDYTKNFLPIGDNIANCLFNYIPSVAKKGDSFLIWYSGHGAQLNQQSSVEPGDAYECLIPLDFQTNGVITNDMIYQNLLLPLKGRGVRLTAGFDCCFSQDEFILNYQYVYKDGKIVELAPYNLPDLQDDFVFFSGCMADQESEDLPGGFGSRANGAMTSTFLNQLKAYNYDITWGDVLLQMNKNLISNGITNQNPSISSSKPLDLQSKFSLVGSL